MVSWTRRAALWTLALSLAVPSTPVWADGGGGGVPNSWETFWEGLVGLGETLDPTFLSNQPFFDLSPTLYAHLGITNQRFNMTPSPDPSAIWVGHGEGGYRVVRERSMDAGVGPNLALNFLEGASSLLSVIPYVGIMPAVGGKAEDTVWVADPDHMEHLPPVLVYPDRHAMLRLTPGDRLVRQMTGGVIFSAGVGFLGMGVSGRYMARGEWEVNIEKLAGSEVLVRVTNTSLQSLTFNASAVVVGLAVGTFRNADRYFSFRLDLSTPYAGLVFDDLIRGNLTKAQELAAQPGSPVSLDTSARVIETGTMFQLWYGVQSILGGEITDNDVRTTANEWRFSQDGDRVMVDHGIHTHDVQTRVFARKRRQVRTFYTTYATTRHGDAAPDETVESFEDQNAKERDKPKAEDGPAELLGNYLWQYEDNRTKGKDLRQVLARLIRETGLKAELQARAPEDGEKLKYVSIKFGFTFSTAATKRLIRASEDPEFMAHAWHLVDERMHAYFDVNSDPDDVCDGVSGSLETCQSKLANQTSEQMQKMQSALQKMDAALTVSKKAFVKAYAEFGKAMMTNRFTFGLARDIAASMPIRLRYEIEGERITRLTRMYGEPVHEIDAGLHIAGEDALPYRPLPDDGSDVDK